MVSEMQRKILYTVFIAALVIVALLPQPAQRCVKYLDRWTTQSVITFGTTKTINAALSVVEDSEVQVGGLTVAAGEIVRPLNDMIARVASVALASAVSLGIQRLLVEIGAWYGFQVLLLLAATLWLIALWAGSFLKFELRPFASRLLLIALVIRLLVPVAILTTGYLGDHFTKKVLTEAQQELEPLKSEATKVNVARATAAPKNANWLDKIKSIPGRIENAVDQFQTSYSVLLDSVAIKADVYSEIAITLIAVFIVQTMIMPVALLWGLIKLVGAVFGSLTASEMESRLIAPARTVGKSKEKSPQGLDLVTEAQG